MADQEKDYYNKQEIDSKIKDLENLINEKNRILSRNVEIIFGKISIDIKDIQDEFSKTLDSLDQKFTKEIKSTKDELERFINEKIKRWDENLKFFQQLTGL